MFSAQNCRSSFKPQAFPLLQSKPLTVFSGKVRVQTERQALPQKQLAFYLGMGLRIPLNGVMFGPLGGL